MSIGLKMMRRQLSATPYGRERGPLMKMAKMTRLGGMNMKLAPGGGSTQISARKILPGIMAAAAQPKFRVKFGPTARPGLSGLFRIQKTRRFGG